MLVTPQKDVQAPIHRIFTIPRNIAAPGSSSDFKLLSKPRVSLDRPKLILDKISSDVAFLDPGSL